MNEEGVLTWRSTKKALYPVEGIHKDGSTATIVPDEMEQIWKSEEEENWKDEYLDWNAGWKH